MQSDPRAFVLQILCSACAPFAIRWPLFVGVILAAALIACVYTPSQSLGLAALAHHWMVGVAQAAARRAMAAVFAAVYLTVSTVMTARADADPLAIASAIVFTAMLYVASLLIGEVVRRANRSTRLALDQQRRAAGLERQAIARDLHDTVAYASTMIVMRAETAKLRTSTDSTTTADFTYIADTARRASDDLRSMLTILRENSALPEASPTMTTTLNLKQAITEVERKLRSHGFRVNMLVDNLADLPATQEYVLARILAECGSNVIKHAKPCTSVRLMIERDSQQIELLMVNEIASHPASRRNLAFGLIGIQELTAIANGTISAQPRGANSWGTHVVIPLQDCHNE